MQVDEHFEILAFKLETLPSGLKFTCEECRQRASNMHNRHSQKTAKAKQDSKLWYTGAAQVQ